MTAAKPNSIPTYRPVRYERTARVAVVLLALLSLTVLLVFGVEATRRFRASEALWVEYHRESQAITDSTARLFESIGYGGLIHNFKNYVLRRDTIYRERLKTDIADYRRETARLEVLLPTAEEQAALDVIRSTFDEYIMKLEAAVRMAPGTLPTDMDKVVKVNDEPAKRAFRLLVDKNTERRIAQEELARAASGDAVSFLKNGAGVAVLIILAAAIILLLLNRVTKTGRALEAAYERIQALIENTPDPMLCVNGDGAIVLVNHAAERFFGYRQDELVHMTVEDLVPERFRATHAQKREAFFSKRGGSRPMGSGQEFYALTKDHGERNVDVNIGFAGDGPARLAIVGIRDVTERRTLQDTLMKAKEEAEAASNAKSQFLAVMSHELRSPLNAILGYSQLMQMGTLDVKNRDYASNIVSAGEHLLDLIGDIMDYSRIEAGSLELEEEAFDLRRMLTEVVNTQQVSAKEHNDTLSLELPDDLTGWVVGDPTRTRQIVINFLSNALKFTEDGSVIVKLSVLEHASDRARVRISVVDTGPGIPPEKREAVFQRFTQADSSTSRRFGGSGLGLAICRSLAGLMGGAVGVSSDVGKGSEFWFEVTLPLTAPMEAKVAPESETKAPRLSVLLVEDIDLNRRMAQLMLERLGHTVTAVANGAEAVEAVQSREFDMVLMDIHMPVLDGIEATRQIRQLPVPYAGTIPILAMTADVAHHHIENYRAAGMNDYIAKPVDIDVMREKLRRGKDGLAASA